MMTYRGRAKNGVTLLHEPMAFSEGAEVDVSRASEDFLEPTWAEVFKDLIGKAEGLPADSSINHDHYHYGTPMQ